MFKFIDKIAEILYGKFREYDNNFIVLNIRRWLGVIGLFFVLFLFVDSPENGAMPSEHKPFFLIGILILIWFIVKMVQYTSKK